MSPRHGRIEIGIGEDDVGAFPPELERQPLEARRRLPHDDPCRLAGAGEGDLVDARMVDKRRPGRRPVAGHDIDHAVGDPRLLRQSREPQAGQRRLLRRLHDDRATGGKGRPPLPGHHQDREVPRDHLPHHPHRLAARVAVVVAVDRDRRALDLVGPAGVVAEALHGQRDVDRPRVGDRLAVVEGFERREVVDLGLDEVGEPMHEPAALTGVHPWPRALVEGGPGGLHGRVDVGGIPFGDVSDRLFGGRIDGGEGPATAGGNPQPGDEQLRLANLGGPEGPDGGGGGGHGAISSGWIPWKVAAVRLPAIGSGGQYSGWHASCCR